MLYGMTWERYCEHGFGTPVKEEEDPIEYKDADAVHAEGETSAV